MGVIPAAGDGRSLTIDVGGIATHVLTGGSGPPLVFLHGTAPAGVWIPLYDALARSFTVYAPDQPGFGSTPRPDWWNGMDDVLLHHEELFRLLGLSRPTLVGFSLGGWLAADLAIYYPDRFRSLVLHNSAGLHVDGAVIPDLCGLSPEQLARTVFNDPQAAAEFFGKKPGLEERLRTFRGLTTLAILAWNPWFDPALQRRARRIRIPTLVLWAEHDRLIPPVYAETFAAAIPGSTLQWLTGCGHMAPLERPEAVADAIIRFALAVE